MKKPEEVEASENQIRELQRVVDYQIREYPIEVIVEKYTKGLEDDKNEIFVPEYQRDFVWSDSHQSKFIESLLIGLPIPYIFVADVGNEDEEKAGRLEIVDGTQRIRTVTRFVQNKLQLKELKKLVSSNGFTFSDLSPSRQRRFNRITLRVIELTEQASEETRRDMFERINSGPMSLNPMETRRGVMAGPFIEIAKELASDQRFARLAPLTATETKRFDREELVCRFFALYDRLDSYGDKETGGNRFASFVDHYVEDMNKAMADAESANAQSVRLKSVWNSMLKFAVANYPVGFAKGPSSKTTPRVRFDSLAVGAALAIRADNSIAEKERIDVSWINGDEFKELTTSDAANNRAKVLDRINFVKLRIS
jgi:hypothetical protein